MDRLLAISRLVKKGETGIEPASLGTRERMQVAGAAKPRAEFFPGTFQEFCFQAQREAEDFALLLARVGGKARA